MSGSSGTEYTGIHRHRTEFNFIGNLVGPHCVSGLAELKVSGASVGAQIWVGVGGEEETDELGDDWERKDKMQRTYRVCEWEARTMHGKLNGTNRMMAGRRTGWAEAGWGKMKEDLGLWFENCSDGGTTTWDGEDGRTARGKESGLALNIEV